MNCRQFRESYSDFADGLLETEVAARRHLAECACCRRFDAAYRAGRGALRALPRLSPSLAFGRRLRERLWRDCEAEPALRQWSGAAGALLVVAAVGLFAFEVRSRVDAESAREAAAADTLVLLVPGVAGTPAVVRFPADSLLPLGDPFHPFPDAGGIASFATLSGDFASYASLASR